MKKLLVIAVAMALGTSAQAGLFRDNAPRISAPTNNVVVEVAPEVKTTPEVKTESEVTTPATDPREEMRLEQERVRAEIERARLEAEAEQARVRAEIERAKAEAEAEIEREKQRLEAERVAEERRVAQEAANAERQKKVDEFNRLRQAANVNMQNFHLMSPAGDNAMQKVERMFALGVDNRTAQAVKCQVADRYLDLAERRMSAGTTRKNIDEAGEFALRAADICQTQRLAPMVQRIRQADIDCSRNLLCQGGAVDSGGQVRSQSGENPVENAVNGVVKGIGNLFRSR